MAVTVKDHEGLHHAVARTVLAAGGASVVSAFLPAPLAWAVAALAVTVAVAPPRSLRGGAESLLWALAAGGGGHLGGLFGLLLGAGAVGASLGRGVGGVQRWVASGFGALGALGAVLVWRAFDSGAALAFLPSGLEALIAGGAGGLMVGVSSMGRHLELKQLPPHAELKALAAEGELGQLLARAATAYQDAIDAMGSFAPEARAAADDMVRRMTRFGQHWRDVDREAARTVPEELHGRLVDLNKRLEACTDPVAQAEFARAREALTSQVESLQEIARGRERAVARLTHQVAMLERLRLAALRHRSVDASRMGSELQPVVEELSQAGTDLDIASEALSEATAAAALPPATGQVH
jgi:hypothetical protein